MVTELPLGSTAVIAAVIAAVISLVNIILAKEQKISEFRQLWIDALRQDLASFFATARAMARASQEWIHFGTASKENVPFAFTEQKISDLRFASAETYYRIQLRLNPNEAEHQRLRHLIEKFITLQHQTGLGAGGDTAPMLLAIETAAAYAPKILKKEWERVKKGELQFRVARGLVVLITLLGFVGIAFALCALVG